ncbi:MAG: hypothetical protein IT458_07410 [Planctomycetes bacterium]|nr:hypothetical protein [Planctomycetota bacterium]
MQTCRAAARLTLIVASFAAQAPAQYPLGHRGGLAIDIESTITAALGGSARWTKSSGCARDRSGNYWVSVGHVDWSAGAAIPGKLVKLDAQGGFVRAIDQPPGAHSSFGLRDLAYDGQDTLYAGLENQYSGNTVFAFDLVSETFVATRRWRAPFIPGQGDNVVRGLAHDPAGDSGRGSLWACDFGPELIEFDRTGRVLRTVVIPGTNPLPYGLAIDPENRSLWMFCLGDSTQTASFVVGIEVDIASGRRTGAMFLGDASVPPLGGMAGGCEFYLKNQEPTLLLLVQADSDRLYEVGGRFRYAPSCGGRIGMTGDAPYGGNGAWALTLRGTQASAAALMIHYVGARQPLGPPVFAGGCMLGLALSPPIFFLPAVVVGSGTAAAPLPIPSGVAAPLYFQWVELGAPPVLPLRLSDPGATFVGY